jgi:cytoskeletal protein RodZ
VETEHFGTYLKQRREARGLSIVDISRATKIKTSSLELLEEARLDDLPAQVFVCGFISAYAQCVGLERSEMLRRYREHLVQHEIVSSMPSADELAPEIEVLETRPLLESLQRWIDAARRPGVALVVLLVVIMATLTLSLFLGRSSRRNGLSYAPVEAPLLASGSRSALTAASTSRSANSSTEHSTG